MKNQASTLPNSSTSLPEGYEPPSREQQGLYWIWLTNIGWELDMTALEAHAAFKKMFNGGKSTMRLHKTQYTEYMNNVKKFAEAHEIELPEGENP